MQSMFSYGFWILAYGSQLAHYSEPPGKRYPAVSAFCEEQQA
jgi:hypothetical protein